MCGILVWANNKGGVSGSKLAASLRLQNHRGPDSQNILLSGANGELYCGPIDRIEHSCNNGPFKVGLGHNRLSIIDLSEASNQPMFSQDRKYAIIFNGVIYNYIELREQMESSGEAFRTKGDTEVLLRLLIKSGIDSVRALNGMWAFAFFDFEEQEIIISRDRYGKKPLFYYHDKDSFIAASEYKAIFEILGNPSRKMNQDYLGAYIFFNQWHTFDDCKTLYDGIYSLSAGSCMVYNIKNNAFRIVKNNRIESFLDGPCDIKNLPADIDSAVNLRLRADVPIGIFVSGGIDSSIVASYANRDSKKAGNIHWYTAKLNAGEDLRYARILADSLGIRLSEVDIPHDVGASEIIRKMVIQYEVPLIFGGVSLSAYYIYEAMRARGIKVVLDGTGGDEIFAGYLKQYKKNYVYSLLSRGKLFSARRFCRGINESLSSYLRDWIKSVTSKVFNDALGLARFNALGSGYPLNSGYRFASYLNSASNRNALCDIRNSRFAGNDHYNLRMAQLFDLTRGVLPVWLYMIDQNSMAHSIESRSPFLDYRLAKYLNLPDELKIDNGFTKVALRKCMPANVNDSLRWRKAKEGFAWDKEDFIQVNSGRIVSSIMASGVVNTIFETDKLVKEWESKRDYFFDYFILRLYSLTMLEERYNCKI